MIERLVAEFYRRVRQDRLLGPIFDAAVDDWDRHLSRMRDFWSSVVLMSGHYKGKPVLVHAMLPGIIPAHFRQWLALFDATAIDVCPAKRSSSIVPGGSRIRCSLARPFTVPPLATRLHFRLHPARHRQHRIYAADLAQHKNLEET
jgi:hemoglobin